jgi:hypothetical protein
MRMSDDAKYEKARVPSTRKGTRAQSLPGARLDRRAAEDHFFGGVAGVAPVDGVAGVAPVDGVEGVPVADVSDVEGDDGVAVPLVEVGSVAGLLSPPPHAIARAASAERTMSFFMI